jgi:putative sigma-54 modulation protein
MEILIRTRSVEITDEIRDLIAKRLQFAFDTFKDRIDTASVHFADINGPRCGVDKMCRITAGVRGIGSVVAKSSAATLIGAATLASSRLKYQISEALRHAQSPATESIRKMPAVV